MIGRSVMAVLMALVVWVPCAAGQQAADTLYMNGTIVTLDAKNSVAQAVAVKGGKIVAVGAEGEVRKAAGEGAKVLDLGGKVMVPGFYAAHDHFPSAGTSALFQVDLNSPPIGKIQDMEGLVAALKERLPSVPKGRWLVGRGYDDTLLKEKRHPTRADLDRVSTEVPIWIVHISGHLGVANSKALQLAKITRNTPQPRGGKIRKDAAREPSGVFEESGSLVSRLIPGHSQADQLKAVEWSVQEYLSKGVTTAAIAGASDATLANLRRAIDKGILKLRIAAMTGGGPLEEARKKVKELDSPLLKTTGIKLWQDGSIQGFTGYLTKPYFTVFNGDAAYRGYPSRTREALVEKVKEWHRAGYRVAIHANGDAAIDDVLFAYAEAQREFPRADARHRIEHCQTAREDQLDRMKELGVTPSFFVGHVYYWGDRHRDIFLGPERAARISPLASAAARGIRFTVHDDTPVTPVNPLLLVWDATNRVTTSGKVLGAEQRISAERALRAVTSDAAWQNMEEDIKGTIEPGKLADFVILDRNPLTVDTMEIRNIRVVETIVGGESVYKR